MPGRHDLMTLRRTFGAFATGVTVVTVGGDNPHGMTANSFTSVSLDPPCLLVCVDRTAAMHDCLSKADSFGVSVLAAHQERVARHFANRRRPPGRQQFDTIEWQPGALTGVPLIAGALAHFECELRNTFGGGDHTIFLGGLLSMQRHLGRGTLLFVNGRYHKLMNRKT